ncbi:MAG TPA: MTH865 family protein [Methanospirillum sp.]|nr:MTH865 family protein [Methanospirillum sp.]
MHAQIAGPLATASFPIETPEELITALSAELETTCQIGDIKKRGEAGTLLKPIDVPVKSTSQGADGIVDRAEL